MSTLSIRRFQTNDEQQWDEFVEKTNNGTLFHTRRFLSYHPPERFTDHSLWILKDGKPCSILPAVEFEHDEKRVLISHRGASYGGFVFRDFLGLRDAFDQVQALIDYARDNGFQGIDITPPPRSYFRRPTDYFDFALLQNGFAYRKREISSIIPLTFGRQDILSTFKESSRRAVRKAHKSGVTVQESEDYASFYAILKKNLRLRHNVTPTHTLEELIRIKDLFPDRIKLFASFYQETMVAGVVLFVCNPRVVLAFYISHDDEFQFVRGVNLLFYDIVDWSIQNHFGFLDFGIFTVNEDPNWGLARFKESFGAQGVFRDSFRLTL